LIGKDEADLLQGFIRDRSKSPAARRRLIRALSGQERFQESIARVLQEEPEMRLAVLQDLYASGAGTKLLPSVLEACLKDPDPGVRREALGFASGVNDPAVNTLVGEMAVRDPSQEVRARALTAASRQAGEGAREILEQGLADPSPYVVYTAAEELKRLGGEDSVEEIGDLLQAENPKVRFIGILMLASMEDEAARDILKDASQKHDDAKTRELAAKILAGDRLDAGSIRQTLGLEENP
jgi:HEAT repeat protein